MAESRCMQRVLTGAALGGAVGGAVGACYGTYEAFAYKVRAYDWTTPHNSRFVSILFFLPLFLLADDKNRLSLFVSLFVFWADTGNVESPTHRTHDHGKCRTVFAVFRRREFVALREEILMRRGQ